MRSGLAARGAAAALAAGAFASGCGGGGAPSPAPGPVAEPGTAETTTALVAAISMPALLSSFSGRYPDAGEVG